jgi:hypothetical protein
MTRGTLIIINAIATAPSWSYVKDEDSKWGKLTIGTEDEQDIVDMKVFEDDFEMATKLLDISRQVPLEKIKDFWDYYVSP